MGYNSRLIQGNANTRRKSFHGHMQLDLRRDGQTVHRVEKDNDITSFITDAIGAGNFHDMMLPANIMPLKQWFSGCLLTAGTNNTADKKLARDFVLTAQSGNDAYNGTNYKRGSYNSSDSGKTANGYRFVFDWMNNYGNGSIGSVCLTRPEIGIFDPERNDTDHTFINPTIGTKTSKNTLNKTLAIDYERGKGYRVTAAISGGVGTLHVWQYDLSTKFINLEGDYLTEFNETEIQTLTFDKCDYVNNPISQPDVTKYINFDNNLWSWWFEPSTHRLYIDAVYKYSVYAQVVAGRSAYQYVPWLGVRTAVIDTLTGDVISPPTTIERYEKRDYPANNYGSEPHGKIIHTDLAAHSVGETKVLMFTEFSYTPVDPDDETNTNVTVTSVQTFGELASDGERIDYDFESGTYGNSVSYNMGDGDFIRKFTTINNSYQLGFWWNKSQYRYAFFTEYGTNLLINPTGYGTAVTRAGSNTTLAALFPYVSTVANLDAPVTKQMDLTMHLSYEITQEG